MILRLGFLYFCIVFAVGFVLGIVRVLILVPRLGVRSAELIEIPVMVAATFVVARWILRRFKVAPEISTRLGIGLVGLALLLVAEFGIAAKLQGLSVVEAVTQRDPVSGAAYFFSLILFGLMPLLIPKR